MRPFASTLTYCCARVKLNESLCVTFTTLDVNVFVQSSLFRIIQFYVVPKYSTFSKLFLSTLVTSPGFPLSPCRNRITFVIFRFHVLFNFEDEFVAMFVSFTHKRTTVSALVHFHFTDGLHQPINIFVVDSISVLVNCGLLSLECKADITGALNTVPGVPGPISESPMVPMSYNTQSAAPFTWVTLTVSPVPSLFSES